MSNSTKAIVRRTLPSAMGEPMIWLTGGALVLCLIMITALASMVVVNGVKTFWPKPIALVTLGSGEVFLGSEVDRQDATSTGVARTLYRVGNRDIGQDSFRWVPESEVSEISYPPDAVMLEREAWGVWFGIPQAVEEREDGESAKVASGARETLDTFEDLHPIARQSRAVAQRLRDTELGGVNKQIEDSRLRISAAAVRLARASDAAEKPPVWIWFAIVAGLVALSASVLNKAADDVRASLKSMVFRRTRGVVIAGLLIAAVVAYPFGTRTVTQADYDQIVETETRAQADLQIRYDEILRQIRDIEAEEESLRFIVVEPRTDRFAPRAQTQPDEPLLMSQVVRLVRPNDMGGVGKLGVFLDRWSEFLTTNPREANTEGGVFPVIVGTVMLTLLLTIAVTPLGVVAALYLREYAKQGFVTSVIRIAVNNLAGVPSIVYGVFGLGFFCYTIGRYVDTGPAQDAALRAVSWWSLFALTVVVAVGAITSRVFSTPVPGTPRTVRHKLTRLMSNLGWGVTAVLVVILIARTPYFYGFFEARSADGTPTFGSRGLLWASLTLALLTLPVVIVSTEEAISAVPDSMRQGSYGCGASKWQTMRRVVLPGALPGILTGAILAMARGAGEVAPLMLVGAVKLNQDLPFSTEAPFLHADRSFMHLGFHIYDLGFQSPDSQAARPLVWTTTLLFLTIVLTLNLAAIIIRARIRGRMTGASV